MCYNNNNNNDDDNNDDNDNDIYENTDEHMANMAIKKKKCHRHSSDNNKLSECCISQYTGIA